MPEPAARPPSAPEAWHVGRTMRVLELLAFSPLSAPQIAAAMHAQPRTVRRVLHRLVDEGYVRLRDERRRVYEPTMRLVALAGQIVDNSGLGRAGRPYVALLHEQTGAAAHLEVPSYQFVLCIAHAAATDEPVRPRLRELVPAHCTAGGKALLAWRQRWSESVLGSSLERYTERTVIESGALRQHLEGVRRDGHATEDSEFQPGVRAVAVPVFVAEEAVAALTVSGPALDIAAVLPRVRASARELSEDLAASERFGALS